VKVDEFGGVQVCFCVFLSFRQLGATEEEDEQEQRSARSMHVFVVVYLFFVFFSHVVRVSNSPVAAPLLT